MTVPTCARADNIIRERRPQAFSSLLPHPVQHPSSILHHGYGSGWTRVALALSAAPPSHADQWPWQIYGGGGHGGSMEWAPRWGEGTAAALAGEGGWLSSLAATSLRPPLLLHPPSSSLAAMLRQPLPSYSLVVARACARCGHCRGGA